MSALWLGVAAIGLLAAGFTVGWSVGFSEGWDRGRKHGWLECGTVPEIHDAS